MKEATITLKLTKDHEVTKTKVTPIEAMLLVAEHHKNAGGNPVTVHKETIKECHSLAEEEYDAEEDKIVTEGGVKKIVTTKVKSKRTIEKPDKRSVDDEVNRLRFKYHKDKVNALSSIRELPTEDFEKALQLGINLTVPTTKFASETQLK